MITRPSIPYFYVFSLRAGLSLRHEQDGDILSIFLHGEEKSGFSLYCRPLPRGLTMDSTSKAIVEKMGHPSFHRPIQEKRDERGSWWPTASERSERADQGEILRYDSLFCSLHFMMRLDGNGIAMVTIMDPRAVP
jgi:hypothetical protein